MTDHSNDRVVDPFDTLRTHVRAVALLERPTVDPDELVERITGGIDRADRSRAAQVVPLRGLPGTRSPRRRRWLAVAATATIVAVGGAGVAAYVASRPSDPVAGIVCRESVEFGAATAQMPPNDDPLAACANLWRIGELASYGQDLGSVPTLVACTGGIGAIDVLPVTSGQSCETFGLTELRAVDAATDDPVGLLSTAIAESNARECLDSTTLERTARDLVRRSGLSDWRVEVDRTATECAVLAIDRDAKVVNVRIDPFRSPNTEETP